METPKESIRADDLSDGPMDRSQARAALGAAISNVQDTKLTIVPVGRGASQGVLLFVGR